ncbi:MAG: DUF1501 domain-containing protein, partial [Opitutales bacterium]|nr:DUF1501 domain-containing protein [Opitutales bacterium]
MISRRDFMRRAALGSISMAGLGSTHLKRSPLLGKGSFGKAKRVIWLHMAGGPSSLDLFDPKPSLLKFDGKDCPEEFLSKERFAFIKGTPQLLGSPYS